MQSANPAAVAATRAKLRQLEADRAARPHCTVTGSSLAHALKSLATIFEHKDSGNSVVAAFDGRALSFDCNGLKSGVAATGTAWPTRYQLPMAAIADALPIRLHLPEVEVGIWKSMLEIDRARCAGVKPIK
jgi:glutamate-1-semialdehyde aminotransferase